MMRIKRKTRSDIVASSVEEVSDILKLYVSDFRRFNELNDWIFTKLKDRLFDSAIEFKKQLKDIFPRPLSLRYTAMGYSQEEIEQAKISDKVRTEKAKVTNKITGKPKSHWTIKYWTARGLSEDAAIKKIAKLQSSNSQNISLKTRIESSPRCVEFYIKRGHTKEKAIALRALFQRTSSKRCIEYWLSRGLNYEESLEALSKYQSASAKEYLKQPEEVRRSRNRCCSEYWRSKGLAESEIKDKLSDNGFQFSLDICISKFGIELGSEIWKARQDRWQETMLSKSPEEIALINSKKYPGFNLNFSSFWKGFKDAGMLYLVEVTDTQIKIGITTADKIEGRYGTAIRKYRHHTYPVTDIYNAYLIEQEMIQKYARDINKNDYGMFGWTEVINNTSLESLKTECEFRFSQFNENHNA